MRHLIRVSFLALSLAGSASFAEEAPPKPSAEKAAATCEHGVKKTICTRCNPKLAPVFKAKGDWCAEHDRAESQCVICNPELAKKGIK